MTATRLTTSLTRALMLVLGLLLLWIGYPYVVGVKGVRYWTDDLIFILVASLIILISYIRHKQHLLEPWRKVLRRKLAMISLIVIGLYVSLGLLDSIHFRKPLPTTLAGQPLNYSAEVRSVLDELLTPLRAHTEETYSAPFALYSYSKKMLIDANGKAVRAYPRLRYGGAHLRDSAQRGRDILLTCLRGWAYALVGWFALQIILTWRLARSRRQAFARAWQAQWRAQTELPWRTVSLTVLILLLLLVPLGMLSPHYHVFGTDKVGIDVFYMALKSIRTGLVIGTLTTLITLPFAVLLGIMAGYFRGWVDDVIQYVYTTLNSIPGVLLIAATILSIDVLFANHPQWFPTLYERADFRLLALCAVLGLTSWTGLCRLLRGETLKLREADYIQAATALGVTSPRIITRHVLPNVMHIVLIIVVLNFSDLVLAESVLSYIGVGVDPSSFSWGNMINNARMELARDPIVWWPLFTAFVLISVLVLAANLFADAVRDSFDPRLVQVLQKSGAAHD